VGGYPSACGLQFWYTPPKMSSYPLKTQIVAGANSTANLQAFPISLLRPAPRLLVIEDDENDAILLRRAFDDINEDICVRFVRDGQQAFAYLAGSGQYAERTLYPVPNLIVLDLKMPGPTGFDVLRWLRAQPSYLRVPVIVLSGSMWPGDIDEAYRLGANSYLVKPARRQDLEEVVQLASTFWFQMNLGGQCEC